MRLQQDRLQKLKNYLHALQASLIVLAIFLTIAVYTRSGPSDGRTGFYFAMCWLTLPALLYLVMVPMWSRTQRFANPYAFATLDGLLVVLWLAAWASVASYVSAGGGCSDFKLGSNGKCKLSEGTVVLGVFVMALFGGTLYLSLRGVMHYRRTGMMPSVQNSNDFEVQTNDAFSHKDDFADVEDAESRRGSYPAYSQAAPTYDPTYGQHEQYAPLHQAEHEPQLAGLGVSYGNSGIGHQDTSYGGAYGDQRHS